MAGKNNKELTKFYDDLITKEAMYKNSRNTLVRGIIRAMEVLEPVKDDNNVRQAIESLRISMYIVLECEESYREKLSPMSDVSEA